MSRPIPFIKSPTPFAILTIGFPPDLPGVDFFDEDLDVNGGRDY